MAPPATWFGRAVKKGRKLLLSHPPRGIHHRVLSALPPNNVLTVPVSIIQRHAVQAPAVPHLVCPFITTPSSPSRTSSWVLLTHSPATPQPCLNATSGFPGNLGENANVLSKDSEASESPQWTLPLCLLVPASLAFLQCLKMPSSFPPQGYFFH